MEKPSDSKYNFSSPLQNQPGSTGQMGEGSSDAEAAIALVFYQTIKWIRSTVTFAPLENENQMLSTSFSECLDKVAEDEPPVVIAHENKYITNYYVGEVLDDVKITSQHAENIVDKTESEIPKGHEGQKVDLAQIGSKDKIKGALQNSPGTEQMGETQKAVIVPLLCHTIRWIRSKMQDASQSSKIPALPEKQNMLLNEMFQHCLQNVAKGEIDNETFQGNGIIQKFKEEVLNKAATKVPKAEIEISEEVDGQEIVAPSEDLSKIIQSDTYKE